MNGDTPNPRAISKVGPRVGVGARLALVVLLAGVAVMAGACGGSNEPAAASRGATTTSSASPRSPGSTSSAGTTTTVAPSGSPGSTSSEESSQSEDLQLAQCMRSHGVPKFPDFSPTEGILNALSTSGVDARSPSFQEALQACRQYNTAGLTPAESAAQNAEGLEFSQCMRTHGVPNFPDPTTGPLGEQVINLKGTGIDPGNPTPTEQAASQACEKLFPGMK
jgi:hypothetical protein